jgi:phage terminase large subunit GpA-like protein
MNVEDVITGVVKPGAAPARQTECEWAQENFTVTTDANKGRFRPAPYQVEPINSIGDPAISETVIMSATRMLKALAILIEMACVQMFITARRAGASCYPAVQKS